MAKDANSTMLEHTSEMSDGLDETPSPPANDTNRRETLYERADEDESPALTKAEFQDMLKDPETLYKEIVELIIKTRDLWAYSKNYQEQL